MRPRTIPCAVAVCLLAAPLGLLAQDSRPAVELYNPRPVFPPAAAGSGVTPEVSVRVRVDPQGRVSDVEVVDIEPSSDFDSVFAEQIKETLGRWRYAPRYEDGEPVESELQWLMPFADGLTSRDRLSGWTWWMNLLGGGARQGPSLLDLPLEQRTRILERQVGAGISSLGAGPRFEAKSDRFVVRTDAGQETADTVARNLESIYNLMGSLFAETIPPWPEQLKIQVFVFSTPDKLHPLGGSGPLAESSPPGFYSQSGLIGLHLQLSSPEEALSHLLHEGTHAYVDRHLVRPGVRLPTWLNEGLAEYIGNSEVKKGLLEPGASRRAPRHYVRMVQGSLVVTKSEARVRLSLREIRGAARRGEALTLAEMLDADQQEFYGERLRLYYSTAWMLVHFLRHGEADWEPNFANLLLYLAEGYRASDAVESAYRQPVTELEPAFRDYLSNF